MHLPDHALSNTVCWLTGITAMAGVGASAWSLLQQRSQQRESTLPPRWWPCLAALVFALQMLNFPISTTTSGHVLGGVALAICCGPRVAILLMTLVLLVQAVVFADGGFAALGANVLNMGLVAVWSGWAIWHMTQAWSTTLVVKLGRAALASWCSVQAAALMCGAQVAISHQIPAEFLGQLFAVHAWIGLGEAVATVGVVTVLGYAARFIDSREPLQWVGLALVIAVTPFAVSLPDGLEWVLQQASIMVSDQGAVGQEARNSLTSWQFSDYQIPVLGEVWYSTIAAAMIGSLLVWMIARFAARVGFEQRTDRCTA